MRMDSISPQHLMPNDELRLGVEFYENPLNKTTRVQTYYESDSNHEMPTCTVHEPSLN